MRYATVVASLILLTSLSVADPPDRCPTIIVSPSGFFSGGSFVIQTPNLYLGFSLPSSRPIIVQPGPWWRPHWRPSTVVVPSFFCIQGSSGPFSFLWCEPLDTSVVIIGRPVWYSPGLLVDPIRPSDPLGGWHSPLWQPGLMTFRLRNRSADEVAKLLNEARVLPDGRFAGLGDVLIASSPSLKTSGVRQQRIRELVAELDRSPGSSRAGSDFPRTWGVEVYRVHPRCPSCEPLGSETGLIFASLGLSGAHLIGKSEWMWQSQPFVQFRKGDCEVIVSGRPAGSEWRILLEGRIAGKALSEEGPVPKGRRPVVLLAREDRSAEGLVAFLTPR
ncbi:MAG: hypothetical protein NZ959_12100 [Armatimonadetes bacterium]|nr:hypothetical protein [Armatimonadota bacterium]MDW8123036.1 hypothetical protein [Armatimonadota bacterium]